MLYAEIAVDSTASEVVPVADANAMGLPIEEIIIGEVLPNDTTAVTPLEVMVLDPAGTVPVGEPTRIRDT